VHKIQSSSGPLHLTFEPVPKILGLVKSEGAPDCYLVSFKVWLLPTTMKRSPRGCRCLTLPMVCACGKCA